MNIARLALCACIVPALGSAYAVDDDIPGGPPVSSITRASTTEVRNSLGAVQIGADYAWGLPGASGKGVVVGIVDTGVRSSHRELRGRVLAGYNFYNGSVDTTDYRGHGTHVAGIIGAAQDGLGMQGVAYEARVLPVTVFAPNGSGSAATVLQGLAYTIGKAPIVNMSLSWGQVDYGGPDIRRSVEAGQLLVIAAGNAGLPNPDWPARFARERWANGQILAVGAVDANNQIASFSNRAGDAMQFYLVAPGVGILSSYNSSDRAYAYMSGTSMAAPHVSGAAATLKSYWPHLGAVQVADILLRTATDLGEPGTDLVYGRGLVNLALALQPIGVTTGQTQAGTPFVIATSSFTPGGSYASAVRAAARSGAFRVAGFDHYGRDYQYDLGARVVPRQPFSFDNLFSMADAQMRFVESVSTDGARLALVQLAPMNDAMKLGLTGAQLEAANRDHNQLAAFSYTRPSGIGREWSIGTGGMASNYFGLAGTPFARAAFAAQDAMRSPFFALVPGHSYAGAGFTLANGAKLKLGMLSGANALALQGTGRSATAQLGVVEIEHPLAAGKLALSSGYLTEKAALLGGSGIEGFGLTGHAGTFFTEAALARELVENTWLAMRASLGYTPQSASGGIVANVSPMTSKGWSLGLLRENAWNEGDRLGFVVSQPMKAVSGVMTVAAATTLDEIGQRMIGYQSFSLRPTKTEFDSELNYFAPTAKYAGVTTTLLMRHNPGHEAGREVAVGVRYQSVF